MDRISAANATADRKFQDADPSSGKKATSLNAAWCTGIQEEMISVMVAGGQQPDATKVNQLLMAIANFTHAVGDYIQTENDQLTPGQRYPWQTWTEVSGLVLVGRDPNQQEFNATGHTGGEKVHALEGQEGGQLTFDCALDDGDAQTGAQKSVLAITINGQTLGDPAGQGAKAGPVTVSPKDATGHNNLQPYRVVRMWRRDA